MEVLGLLSSEIDLFTKSCLLLLGLIICRDERGEVNCANGMTLNLFMAVACSLFQCDIKSDDNECQLPKTSSFTTRKRKFGKTKGMGVGGIECEGNVEFSVDKELNLLCHKWPALFSLTVGIPIIRQGTSNMSQHNIDLKELSDALGLTILSRYFVAKVHETTNEQISTIDLQGESNKDHVVTKNEPLDFYQRALRSSITLSPEVTQPLIIVILESFAKEVSKMVHLMKLDVVVTANNVILNKTESHLSPSSRCKIWQFLNLIESACFRSIENQV